MGHSACPAAETLCSYGSCSSLRLRQLVCVGVPALVGLAGVILVAAAPEGPCVAVGLVAAGPGDDGSAELVGAEYPVALRDLGIFADQATEPVPPQDPDIRVHNGRTLTPIGRTWQSALCGR
jgi:hypothetical protein